MSKSKSTTSANLAPGKNESGEKLVHEVLGDLLEQMTALHEKVEGQVRSQNETLAVLSKKVSEIASDLERAHRDSELHRDWMTFISAERRQFVNRTHEASHAVFRTSGGAWQDPASEWEPRQYHDQEGY